MYVNGGGLMHALFVTLLVIVSLALIVVVLLQSGKSAGLSGAISGGAEQLFGKQKARGIDLYLHRTTVVLSVLFFILTIAVSYFKL
jgi:preprotein translocase subunit SecG